MRLSLRGKYLFLSLRGEHLSLSLRGEHLFLSLRGEHLFLSLRGKYLFLSLRGEAVAVSLMDLKWWKNIKWAPNLFYFFSQTECGVTYCCHPCMVKDEKRLREMGEY